MAKGGKGGKVFGPKGKKEGLKGREKKTKDYGKKK